MPGKKIFILLPDGVGLRNFAYTNFYELGRKMGFEIIFWNKTDFDLLQLGFEQVKIRSSKLHPLTDILKKAANIIELKSNRKKRNDDVYLSYLFPLSNRTSSDKIKKVAVKYYVSKYRNSIGRLRNRIQKLESQTDYFRECVQTLERERPALVFCTNQRIVHAIAPMEAAKKLGIPTATFIFSWDNLPKATKIIDADYNFVWSEHMKKEFLNYYPATDPDKILITGTPQFEAHYNTSLLEPREKFLKIYNLDSDKKYICFSGDDITTSPNDPAYLSDVADAVRGLNKKGHNLGIIFRRCPVDFSNRFDQVLSENADLITAIAPEWKSIGRQWNAVLPTREDLKLQMNTIAHTEMVINLGSSMVFDFAAQGKPCGFINYNVSGSPAGWSVEKIYNYVHFRSMPDKRAVFWLNSPHEIGPKIEEVLSRPTFHLQFANDWFEKINLHPAAKASERIWENIAKIVSQ